MSNKLKEIAKTIKNTEDLKFGDPCEVKDHNSNDWNKAVFVADLSKAGDAYEGNYPYSTLYKGSNVKWQQCRPIQEPREFWVNGFGTGGYGQVKETKVEANMVGDGRKELLHLIEYSEFEQLQEENERLKKELEELKGGKG